MTNKVEKFLEYSLDPIPSPSVKIQILGGKVCLRCKGKTFGGNAFPPIIWIFTEDEGDWIESRLSY